MNKVFVSWSGGKDSCLSYYRAIKNNLEVSCLVNILNQDGKHSCTHGLPASFLRAQARSIGVPMIQMRTCGANYESDLKDLCRDLKKQGIDGAVFGNGDVEHQWIDRVCREVDITPHFPLDELSKDEVIRELINANFEAISVTSRADVLNKEWLGQRIDMDFLKRIDELKVIMNLTPGGESGVYHTVVLDGPIFRDRLEITSSEKVIRDGYWFLNILDIEEKPSYCKAPYAGSLINPRPLEHVTVNTRG